MLVRLRLRAACRSLKSLGAPVGSAGGLAQLRLADPQLTADADGTTKLLGLCIRWDSVAVGCGPCLIIVTCDLDSGCLFLITTWTALRTVT